MDEASLSGLWVCDGDGALALGIESVYKINNIICVGLTMTSCQIQKMPNKLTRVNATVSPCIFDN